MARTTWHEGDEMQPEIELAIELMERRRRKFRSGESEYGNFRYQEKTTLQLAEEVLDEIVDAMNWLELMFYKIRTLQEAVHGGSFHRPDQVSPPILPDRLSPGPGSPGTH